MWELLEKLVELTRNDPPAINVLDNTRNTSTLNRFKIAFNDYKNVTWRLLTFSLQYTLA